MQGNSPLVIILALITLGLVLSFGAWQLIKVRRSQANRNEKPGGIAGPSDEP